MCWRSGVVFLAVLAVGYCQTNFELNVNKKKPYYEHHREPYHLFYAGGILYYLSFILIKLKIVYVLGTIFAIFMVVGKVFAIIKYAEYMKEPKHHHEPEKIYVQGPSHGHSFYSQPSFSPPSYNSFPQQNGGITVDKLPPNAEIAGGHGQFYDSPPPNSYGGQEQFYNSPPPNSYGGGGQGQFYDSPPPNAYGRSYPTSKGNVAAYYEVFTKMIKKMNVTELAFEKMQLKTNDCKRKFVCKIDFDAKSNPVLSVVLNFFRDDYYNKFKTSETVSSLDDCNKLYTCAGVNMF